MELNVPGDSPPLFSVAMAQAVFFATFANKLRKFTKIFMELDHTKSRGVFCQLYVFTN